MVISFTQANAVVNPTMTKNATIAERLREVLLNGHWIANTNYKEQLLSITWEQAIQQFQGLNTIAALTYHIDYYLVGLLHTFETGRLEISDKYSFNLPPIQSASDWNNLVTDFISHAERFIAVVEQMDDNKLSQPFVQEKYGTIYRNIEAVVEHSYYHLGQISLIKKITP